MSQITVLLFIALRYICRKTIDQFSKCIYWISSITIMLGIVALIVVLSVMNGFERNVKQDIVHFTPHILLITTQKCIHIKNVPNIIFDKLSNNIKYVQPLIISDVVLKSAKNTSIGVMLGINSDYFEPLLNYLININVDHLIAGKYYIILGAALARSLGVSINDQIRVIVPSVTNITPIGCIMSQRLFTVSGIYTTNRDVDNYQVLVHQLDASKMMHYPSEAYISGWRIWLYDPFLIDDCYRASLLCSNWIWKDWREYKGIIFQAMKIEKGVMFVLLGLIVIAACFNVMSFLVLLITDKNREIAILQTYGLTRIQIMLIFLIQGISNGVFGTIFGTGLGILLSLKLNEILSFFDIFPSTLLFPVEIRIFQILFIITMTFVIIILTTFYPAWYAASTSPSKILRYG